MRILMQPRLYTESTTFVFGETSWRSRFDCEHSATTFKELYFCLLLIIFIEFFYKSMILWKNSQILSRHSRTAITGENIAFN